MKTKTVYLYENIMDLVINLVLKGMTSIQRMQKKQEINFSPSNSLMEKD